jgi:putative ABC transport system permease protein
MKASMYFNYTSRSLLRGGQRTVLAVFCVAVGVMAIVALQLVGLMINNALTGDVRDANGGDISVTSNTRPFTPADLAFFNQLKQSGTITNYTTISTSNGSTSNVATITSGFAIMAVDPGSYPLVTPPTFVDPANGNIANLLTGNGVIVDKTLADQYNKKVGDTLNIHVGQQNQAPRLLHVTIAGIVTDSGVLAQSSGVMLVSQDFYNSASPNAPVYYDTVYITTSNQAHTDQAVKAINAQFPIANTQTVADALKSQQSSIDLVKKFLEIAGLLALLIGGVGIVNTMQVLLSRRKIEIAMLKTTGYRRLDLYLLFGLEAGLLGLAGGVVGAAAATGVSLLVRNLVQQTFSINIPFVLDPLTIGGGVLIGLVTALIFGLMPIVQAANIRPLNVIRELPEGNRAGSIGLTVLLLVILSVLFCVLAIVILNDVLLGIGAVYGAFIFLLLLSLFFGLVVFVISIMPVPERITPGFLAWIVAGLVLSVLLYLVLPTFGAILLGLSLFGFVVAFLPRSWKSSTKIALRNIGRQRARTTTTMLALFVGVFTIGLILVLGQDLRDKINNTIATSLTYNVVTIATGNDANTLQSQLATIPGITKQKHTTLASAAPLEINGQPIQDLLGGNTQPSFNSLGRQGVLALLSSVEGYDVANNQFPATSANGLTLSKGRNLNASDAGTDNVLIPWPLANLAPLKGHIDVGSTITLASVDGKTTKTVTVVGIYQNSGLNISIGNILGTANTVQALTPHGLTESVFYMKIDTSHLGKALGMIGTIAPGAFVFNLANIGDFINQYLNYALLTLSTIAGLSLLAGVIIIANAVALAMLERRRELGILKSVGYTSGDVLGEVLIENAVIGGAGALLAMLLVTFAMSLLGRFVFKSGFDVNGLIVLALIAGAALLAVITAILVAYGSVRVRPLEVLRYE